MPFIFYWILKFSISLAVMYVFYQLVLRPLTFYQWNRFYLLGYSLLCFAIPFINIEAWIQQPGVAESRIITIIPALGQYPAGTALSAGGGTVHTVAPAFNLYYWLGIVLTAGTAIMLGRIMILYSSLLRLRRRAVLLSADTQMRLFETDMAISPFSFGRSVYFNATRHTEEELEQIIRHEYVHVKQRHTIDLLVAELLCLVNWYNPFAWMIRYSIRQNLEFIADNKVIEHGVDKKEYQYLLLKVVGISHYRIANNFNFSNLKKRISMMNKMKSARLHLGRFLFVLPLLAVLLLAFRGTYTHPGEGPNAKFFITSGIVVDLFSKKPLPGALVKETKSGITATTDARGFYRMSIPVLATDSPFRYVATLKGYEQTETSFAWGPKGIDGGIIEILAIRPTKGSEIKGMYLLSFSNFGHRSPIKSSGIPDPSYDDALKVYHAYVQEMDDLSLLSKQITNNPQVALFYTTEDKLKQIVFLKDGGIEKYGYPGTPAITEMEEKYGKLPSFDKNNGDAPTYYNKQWQEISEKLEKTFVPSGHAAKTILFPGDSRVLVQFTSGKVVEYDMDYDKERAAFESLFGKLEAAPPPSRSDNAPLSAPSASNPPAAVNSPAAPAPAGVPGVSSYAGRQSDTSIHPWLANGQEPLYIIDGVEQSVRDMKSMNPNDIQSIDVLKGESSIAKYGEQGRYGAVEIRTRNTLAAISSRQANTEPLFIIDGEEQPDGAGLSKLKQEDIARIDVWKDAASLVRYGDRAKNGVVEIITKKQQPKVEEATLTADSLVWNDYLLVIKGKISMNGNVGTVDGRLSFPQGLEAAKIPLIVYNGKVVEYVHAFSAAKGRYRLVSLNKEDAISKYGEKAKNGALEITALQ